MKRVNGWWVANEEDQAVKDHVVFCKKPNQVEHLHRALEYVTDWSLAIDCGAHIGLWAKPMTERFKWVHAFEPEMELARCLRQNLRDCYNATIWPVSVGESFGCLSLSYFSSASMSTRVREEAGFTPVIALDALGLSPGFVKIDVEGYEVKALRGMRETLKRSRPVVCIEWKAKHIRRFGDDVSEAESILREAGLSLKGEAGVDRIWA